MPVELGYFTLLVKDVARAKQFYGALFGWEFEGNGHVKNTRFPMGLSTGGPVDVSFAYFRVENLDEVLAHVASSGGTVRQRNAPPSGANAICADDQGTVFALWQPAPGFE
jgi:predicted enzyme related to lactoylglutathione lyase